MKSSINFLVLIFGLLLANAANARNVCALGSCIDVPSPPSGGGRWGGSRGSERPENSNYDPGAARRSAAQTQNNQGIEAWNKGDWAAAASYFQQALQNSPDDPVIRQNFANAQAKVKEMEAAERQRKKDEAERIERQRQRAEAERIERERVAEEKRKKEFIEDRDRDVATLMDSSGAPMSQMSGMMGNDGRMESETDPGAQLMSIEHSSRGALLSPVAEKTFMTPGKADKEMAGKGFDTTNKKTGNLAYPDKKQQQIPPSALDKQIPPEARDDPEIKQAQAWYRKLDALKAEKEQKIAEIKEQQKTSKDPLLAVKIATLANDVKRADDDQAKATDAVRKKLKKSYHLDMRVTPAPATTETKTK